MHIPVQFFCTPGLCLPISSYQTSFSVAPLPHSYNRFYCRCQVLYAESFQELFTTLFPSLKLRYPRVHVFCLKLHLPGRNKALGAPPQIVVVVRNHARINFTGNDGYLRVLFRRTYRFHFGRRYSAPHIEILKHPMHFAAIFCICSSASGATRSALPICSIIPVL